MSTPNPTHIIADAIAAAALSAPGAVAEHVVSKLTDAGYSIIPSEGIVRTYQAASTLGHKYMSPKTFGCDREEAERWFKLHQKMLDGLPGVDTVRLEYRDEYVTGWLPLTAAAAEGEKP